jgi:hypothetical protein
VVLRKPDSPPAPNPPGDKALVGVVSTAIPYLLSTALHLAAVFLLFKAVTNYLEGPDAAPQLFEFLTRAVFCLGALLLGVTVAARVPRLVNRGWRWRWLAWLVFAGLAGLFWVGLPDGVACFFGRAFGDLPCPNPITGRIGRWTLVIVAMVVASTGWWLKRKPGIARRTLIGLGTAAVLLMVSLQIYSAGTLAHHPAVWPVVLAGAAFLYLWWLGILVFDLAFVWHRYIRNSVAVETLGHWYHHREAPPKPLAEIMSMAKKR